MKIIFRYLLTFLLIPLSFSAFAEGGSPLPHVKLETSLGDIVIELNQEKAPNTVANFLSYVNDGFYDGTIFHRVIKDFMIQGGGFTEDFVQKTTKAPIKNEANNGLSNVKGSIAMARTGDPHSATAQFFINNSTILGFQYLLAKINKLFPSLSFAFTYHQFLIYSFNFSTSQFFAYSNIFFLFTLNL